MKRSHAPLSAELDAKRVRSDAAHNESDGSGDEADDSVDVEEFLKRDCEQFTKRLIEQAKARAEEMRNEFEKGKKALLDNLEAEKENLHDENDPNAHPTSFSVKVVCLQGPYKKSEYTMTIDAKHHSSCYIGRSTGRKFRPPHGVSLPKDLELSTTHGQLKMEKDGRVLFIDLDSTNGSTVNADEVEPHEPYELDVGKPVKLAVGGSVLQLTFSTHP